jgi:hypothetical protein
MDIQKRVGAVARKLLARGVKPLRIDKGTEFTDPAIWITESIYIQVGDDYVVIFKSSISGLSTWNCSLNINSIMDNLRQAIGNK